MTAAALLVEAVPHGLSTVAELFVAAVLLLAALQGNRRLEAVENQVRDIREALIATGVIHPPHTNVSGD